MLIIDWIRHTSLQIDGSYSYGQTDVQVSDNFESEAAVVKQRLQGVKYDAVYTSPLSRASKLARYCGYEDAIADHRIMEIFLGEWELKKWADIIMYDNLDDWFANFHNLTAPGGENLHQLLDRVTDFIHDVRSKRYSRIAVFCHGGVINSARHLNREISKALIFREVPPYGSINTIKYSSLDQRKID
ncbi:histidine phosphatase family protein [Porphyromonas sp.]|uniref:histidine phosphatase family protein n=1 Tax=Porphyromonas sp. TaxID=1924944 RepID=UPI0026DD7716|nr:histidine phosphatase family protein [Porphyromonas sp.]MDO4695694.1 histidine phosphatase family protein [Porphyromonas sp.]MDO4771715.1 histidine phosphatase family protein [Porphyromonas sp.]